MVEGISEVSPQQVADFRGKAAIDRKTDEIVERAKSGGGEEVVVHDFLRSAIEERRPSLGAVSEICRELDDIGNLEDPGVFDTAVRHLKKLYRVSGMGGYELQVEVPEGADEDERARLVREQVGRDVADYSDAYAEHRTREVYARPRAELEVQRSELVQMANEADLSRGAIRRMAHKIDRMEGELWDRVVGLMNEVGAEDVVYGTYVNRRSQRRNYQERSWVDFGSIGEEQREGVIEETCAEYHDSLESERENERKKLKREEKQAAFAQVAEGGNDHLTQIAEHDYQEAHLRDNLLAAVEAGDSEAINGLVLQIRKIQLERKAEVRLLDVDVAVQATEQKTKGTRQARGALAEKILGGGFKGTGKEVKAVISAAVDEQRANLASVGVELGQAKMAFDVGVEVADMTKDALSEGLVKLDSSLGENVRELGRGIGGRISSVLERAQEGLRSVGDRLEATHHSFMEGYYKGRHSAEEPFRTAVEQMKVIVAGNVVATEGRVAAKISPEHAKEGEEQAEVALRLMEQKLDEIQKEVAEAAQNNEHLRKFDDRMMREVVFIFPEKHEAGRGEVTGGAQEAGQNQTQQAIEGDNTPPVTTDATHLKETGVAVSKDESDLDTSEIQQPEAGEISSEDTEGILIREREIIAQGKAFLGRKLQGDPDSAGQYSRRLAELIDIETQMESLRADYLRVSESGVNPDRALEIWGNIVKLTEGLADLEQEMSKDKGD